MNLETLVLPLKTEDNAFRAGMARATQLVTALISAMASVTIQGVKLASDLAETVSKTNVVFEENAKEILNWGESASTAMGMSKNTALAAASQFGNLFRAMKIGKRESADMSKGLVELAADLASFNNMDPTDVLEKLRAGLVGETEPLRAVGVNLNQATLEAKALELGLWDGVDALDAGAKAQAAYALILEQTSLAQGDFARTSEGLANQQRILAAQWEDLKTKLGNAFLPVFTQVVTKFNEFLGILQQPGGIGEKLGKIMEGADTMVGGLLKGLGDAVNDWVQGGGPEALSDSILSFVENIGTNEGLKSKTQIAAEHLFSALKEAFDGIQWQEIGEAIDEKITEAIEAGDWTGAGQSFGKVLEDFVFGDGIQFAEGGSTAAIQQAISKWLLGAMNMASWGEVSTRFATLIGNSINSAFPAIQSSSLSGGQKIVASLYAGFVQSTPLFTGALSTLNALLDSKLREIAKTFFNRALGWANQAIQGFNSGVGGLLAAISGIVNQVNGVLRRINTTFQINILPPISMPTMPSWLGGSGGSIGGGQRVKPKARASGGPVIGGQLYGFNVDKEWFVPNTSGRVEQRMEQTITLSSDSINQFASVIARILPAELQKVRF